MEGLRGLGVSCSTGHSNHTGHGQSRKNGKRRSAAVEAQGFHSGVPAVVLVDSRPLVAGNHHLLGLLATFSARSTKMTDAGLPGP